MHFGSLPASAVGRGGARGDKQVVPGKGEVKKKFWLQLQHGNFVMEIKKRVQGGKLFNTF
jgi:hypothetical protein